MDPQRPTPLEQQALQHRRRQVYDETSGAHAVFYSPEDVIVYKLKYYPPLPSTALCCPFVRGLSRAVLIFFMFAAPSPEGLPLF